MENEEKLVLKDGTQTCTYVGCALLREHSGGCSRRSTAGCSGPHELAQYRGKQIRGSACSPPTNASKISCDSLKPLIKAPRLHRLAPLCSGAALSSPCELTHLGKATPVQPCLHGDCVCGRTAFHRGPCCRRLDRTLTVTSYRGFCTVPATRCLKSVGGGAINLGPLHRPGSLPFVRVSPLLIPSSGKPL